MIVMFLNSYKLESVKHMLSCEQKCIWKITWISVQVLQNSWNLKCVYFDRKVISICYLVVIFLASLVAQRIKHLPAMLETQVRSLAWEDPLEMEMDGNPLQYSCLENPMDRGAWKATVHWVAKSQTSLKQLSTQLIVKSRRCKIQEVLKTKAIMFWVRVSFYWTF